MAGKVCTHIVQEAAARKQRQQEQEAYRLARAKPSSWAAHLNLSFADYAHAGAVVCFRPLHISPTTAYVCLALLPQQRQLCVAPASW
jgi:hypothetical protein